MPFERWSSTREEDWRRRSERDREQEERERRHARMRESERERWGEPRDEWREERERERYGGGWRESWAAREFEPYRPRYTRSWMIGRGERGSAENFRGLGPARYRRPDSRIEEDLNDELTEHPGIDATDIEVVVQNGVVVLKGSVRTRAQKRMAEDVAEFVSGVQDVRNELRVGPPPGTPEGLPLAERAATSREGALMRPMNSREDFERDEERERMARRGEPLRSETDPEREPLEGRGEPWSEPRLRPGMVVVDVNGDKVGEVKETHGDVFHLDRPMRRDLYVPYDAVREIGERHVTLRYHADELDKLNWQVPDLIGGGRRRH